MYINIRGKNKLVIKLKEGTCLLGVGLLLSLNGCKQCKQHTTAEIQQYKSANERLKGGRTLKTQNNCLFTCAADYSDNDAVFVLVVTNNRWRVISRLAGEVSTPTTLAS